MGQGSVLGRPRWVLLCYSSLRSQKAGGMCRQNSGHADPKRPGSCSSPGPPWLRWCPGLYPAHLGMALARPSRGSRLCTGFASSRDAGHPQASPLCQLAKDVAQAPWSTTVAVKIEAQREVRVAGPQLQVALAADSGLGAHGWWTKRSWPQNPVLAGPGVRGQLRTWSRRLWVERRLWGGQRLEEGESLGLFCPNAVEERDKSRGRQPTALSLLFWERNREVS